MADRQALEDLFKLLDSEFPHANIETETLELPLRSDQWATRDDVAQVIADSGAAPDVLVSQLRSILEQDDAGRRCQAARALFWIAEDLLVCGVEGHRRWLTSFVSDRAADQNEDPLVRCYLIRFAGFVVLTPEEMIPVITVLSGDTESRVRSSAILALADYGPLGKSVWPEMVDGFQGESPVEVWRSLDKFAEEARMNHELEQQFAERLIPILVDRAGHAEGEIRRVTMDILATLGERATDATDVLKDAVLDEDVNVAYSAIFALGAIGQGAGAAVSSLVKARNHELLRWVADDALASIAPKFHTELKLEDHATGVVDERSLAVPSALFIKPREVQVGTGASIILTDKQGYVVQALVECRNADESQLEKKSGVLQPGRVLKRVIKKHPLLSRYILLPGRKGKGGYRTTITFPPSD